MTGCGQLMGCGSDHYHAEIHNCVDYLDSLAATVIATVAVTAAAGGRHITSTEVIAAVAAAAGRGSTASAGAH